MSLTIGSLFSGIGGLELGLERAGLGPVVWQVEREPYCRAVLAKHWPAAQRFDDVCTVGAHNLTPVDVICGGFPCQDVSHANTAGAGLDGERSGLWYECSRIVRELRPRYLVVENVAALLVRGLDRVLGELAALGYDAEWHCVPAAAVGAPHVRDRVFVVAHAREVRREPRRAWESLSRTRVDGADGEVADSDGARREERDHAAVATRARFDRWRVLAGGGHWDAEPGMGRVAHGVPPRLVRPAVGALGNAVVPQVAEVVGRLIVAREQDAQRGAA